MKKVAFLCCLFCGLITQAIGATYNCKPQYIGDWASRRSNEYLFMGKSNYDDKMALVCGHKGTDGCEHGTIVVAGGYSDFAYHKRTKVDDAVYKCDTSGGSSWENIGTLLDEGTFISELNECSSTPDGFIFGSTNDFDFYVSGFVDFGHIGTGGGAYAIAKEVCKVAKKGSTPSDDSSSATSEEEKAATTKASEKKSEQDIGSSDTSGTDVSGTGATGTGTSGAGTSAQTQSGDAEENEEDKWLEPCSKEDLANVSNAKEGRYIYRTKDKIVCAATKCKEGYYLVRNAEGKSQGWCKYGTDPYATTNASETTSGQGASSSDAFGTGATGADATGTGTSGAGASAQKQPIDTGTSLTQSQTSRVRALTQKIKNAASQLDSISSNFKVSGWKDAEGKFNTARLASDSIAGVVLGTAGGLITSHVVKKNQVENGFQDIKCTIGGQSVANWGDEFSIGIQ